MQEVRNDGNAPKYKEANSLEGLFPEIKKSLNDEGVDFVKVGSPKLIIPNKKKKSMVTEQRVREIVKEELKIAFMEFDPLFKKILMEIEAEEK